MLGYDQILFGRARFRIGDLASSALVQLGEARERINVENVTCGMEQSQPGLLQSQALWSSGEAAFMVSPWNECL